MPDGTVVSVPDADAPPPASLTASFAPDRDAHVVYLALPAWNDSAANVRFTVAGPT
jgi:predicted component of type VI protein secretion system